MAAKDQAQIGLIRQALGISDAVPDSDIEALMSSPAGEAVLKHIQGQGQKGILGDITGFVQSGVAGLEQYKGTKEIESALGKIGAGTPAPPKKKAAPKAATSQQDALQQLAQYLTSNYAQQGEIAMGQMGQELAQQNASVTSTVDQYLTGGGASSGNAAVDAAQAAYAKAYSAGEGLNSTAYGAMGLANAQYLQAAPSQPVLNLLTQGLGSGQYKELPPAVVNALPQSVRTALSQAGVTETTGTGAGTPIPTGKTPSTGAGAGLLSALQNAGALGVANPQSGISAPSTNPANVTG